MWRAAAMLPLLIAAGEASDGEFIPDRGQNLWVKRCAFCHGPDGRAQTKLGQRYAARDFTDPAWQERTSDEQIVQTILLGVPGKKMKGYRADYADADVTLLLAMVRSFAPQDR